MIATLLSAVMLAWQAPVASAPVPDDALRVPSRRWAIVVGAGDYEHLGRLKYAEKDARAVADALVTRLAFEPDHVRLLVDHPDEPELTPTTGHVYGELEALIASRRANRSDLVLFYFCGHGVGGPDGDFLLPTDARKETARELGLPVRRVVDRLAGAGMHNVLVIVDACREGQENPFGRDLFAAADKARLAVVLGCEPGEQSYEDASFGHGVFTHFLLQALADDTLVDPTSGALWASRVARETSRRVEEWSRGKDPSQRPVAWTDATRDILLGASAKVAGGAKSVESFVASARVLEDDAHLAALGTYAETLFEAGRSSEAVEVLKTAEQLGPLPPDLALLLGLSALDLGRTVEAGRAFADVRARSKDTFVGWLAAVVDTSGSVTERERADAARALWRSRYDSSLAVLVRMVEAAIAGGAGVEARAMCEAALARAEESSRVGRFLRGALASMRGEDGDAIEALEAALTAPGDFPLDELLVQEILGLQFRSRGAEAAIAYADACVERWPDDGRWRVERAFLRSLAAESAQDLDLVLTDARAALEFPLNPESLWGLTRALGIRAKPLAAAIRAQAARHPLAWQAGLSALVVDESAEPEKALEGLARLAARPAQVYVAWAGHRLSLELERASNALSGRDPADPATEELAFEAVAPLEHVVELLAPMASTFGDDPESWKVLSLLFRSCSLYEPDMRLLERHLGAQAAAGRLPRELVDVYARACLDTGRFEAFEKLGVGLDPTSLEADTLAWLGAAYLAANGRVDEARERIGERERPLAQDLVPIAAPLRALIAARPGSETAARLLLPDRDPDDALALALTGIAARALGDAERDGRIDAALEDAPGHQGFFARVAFWKGDREATPLLLAVRAAYYFPSNPLLADASFASEPALAAFAGVHEYRISDASGPIPAQGAALTLTVKSSGQMVGTLEIGGRDPLAFKGTVDRFGNLAADIPGSEGPCRLYAKIAPRAAYAEVEILNTVGQPFQILTPDCLPYAWFGKLQE